MGLVRRHRVDTRGSGVIPKPTLVGHENSVEIAMPPVEDFLALWQEGRVHHRDLGEAGYRFPLSAIECVTALIVNGGTVIGPVVKGQASRPGQLICLCSSQPEGLARAHQ